LRDDTAATRNAEGAAGRGARARLEAIRGAGRRGALGIPEIAALAAAALLLLAAVCSYLFLLVPERSRLQTLNSDREATARELQSKQGVIGEGRTTQERVQSVLGSLEDFELQHLGHSASGTKNVVEELNRLILKNSLRISGGITFTQLQETVPGTENARRAAPRTGGGQEGPARVVQSVFPGIGIVLTVEGTYQNLRRFIHDIEADRQFVVINSVELEGVTDTTGMTAAPVTGEAPAQTASPSRGAFVSLRLDMAAYFRRAAAGAAAPAQ